MSEDTEQETPQEDTRDAETRRQASAMGNLASGADRSVNIDKAAMSLLSMQSSKKQSEAEAARKKQLMEVQVHPPSLSLGLAVLLPPLLLP